MKVAVKVLNGKNQYEEECAKREIDIQKTLSHPNCLKIYGVSHDPENKTCLIVPYAEGVLQDIIMKHTKRFSFCGAVTHSYTYAQKKQILIEIATAIAYLHSLGYVHRDIKVASASFCERSLATFSSSTDTPCCPISACHGS